MDSRLWIIPVLVIGIALLTAGLFLAGWLSRRINRRREENREIRRAHEAGVEAIQEGRQFPATGIVEADRLLQQKDRLCEKKGIRRTWRIGEIPEGALTRRDLISLLGNLLDNAIEATERSDRWIRAEAQVRRGQWILVVENSKPRNETPLESGLQTTKADRDRHGLGTGIVDEVVASADGYVKRRDDGDRFRVFVAVPVRGKGNGSQHSVPR